MECNLQTLKYLLCGPLQKKKKKIMPSYLQKQNWEKIREKNGIDESNVDMSTFWNEIITVIGLIFWGLF